MYESDITKFVRDLMARHPELEELQKSNPAVFAEFKAEKPSKFLFFEESFGLDGARLGKVNDTPAAQRDAKQTIVATANNTGDRRTLVADSFIPATMAVIYLLILLYFKSIGGYKPVHIEGGAKSTFNVIIKKRKDTKIGILGNKEP